MIKKILKSLPYAFIIRNYFRNVTGHYYSPLPSMKDTEHRKKSIYDKRTPEGIDLNHKEQVEKLELFSKMNEDIPFYDESRRIRFDINNNSFSYDDAPILHYMMRALSPDRIIQIGVGASSACMLDTNDLYLNGKTGFCFIDVCLNDLKAILKDGDSGRITMIESMVQDVKFKVFEDLEANDILFIDSSHIMKIGSDVHTILFDIFPRLKKGVHIHIHDVRYPFQYSEEDFQQKIFWNEAYILRAFLQYNESFRISFWLNYLLNSKPPLVKETSFLPLNNWAMRFGDPNTTDVSHKYAGAGGSIWLTKVK
jgi:hypothetical protein